MPLNDGERRLITMVPNGVPPMPKNPGERYPAPPVTARVSLAINRYRLAVTAVVSFVLGFIFGVK